MIRKLSAEMIMISKRLIKNIYNVYCGKFNERVAEETHKTYAK